jgi:UDP-glucose 4-epimerase
MSHAPSFEKIVVTGATGFIGRHLLEELVAAGHRPTAIARRLDQLDDLSPVLEKDVRWVELDLLDHDALDNLLGEEKPSLLFHLAGYTGVGKQGRTTEATLKALNVDATRYLLETATRVGTGRIVIVGSAEEYGNQPGPFDESMSLDPISPYGKSKAEATRIALDLHERINCPVVILRLFTVYGPRQPRGMFVRDAIESAVNNLMFAMSDGTQERDLVFIDDLRSALMASAWTPDIEGSVFNIGSGRSIRLVELARMIWEISQSSGELNVGVLARTEDDMKKTWADTSIANERLGWLAKVDLETGLRATIEWASNRCGVR